VGARTGVGTAAMVGEVGDPITQWRPTSSSLDRLRFFGTLGWRQMARADAGRRVTGRWNTTGLQASDNDA
jgi:hypothetical protein